MEGWNGEKDYMEKGLSKIETIYKCPFITIPTGCCHMILIYGLIPPEPVKIGLTGWTKYHYTRMATYFCRYTGYLIAKWIK